MSLPIYKVTITKTADGLQEYMQIMAADQFSVNVVLIGKFIVDDSRVDSAASERKRDGK